MRLLPLAFTSYIGNVLFNKKNKNGQKFPQNYIFKLLQMERVESDKEQNELVEEWNHISAVFDRFFFCCIFVLTGATTFTLLLLAPRFSHRTFDTQI